MFIKFFLLLAIALTQSNAIGAQKKVAVLWLSIDGLKPEYLDRTNTPNFDSFTKEGIYTRSLLPVFPSITFPSHVTLSTGVGVKEHGISSNAFYDSKTKTTYSYPGDMELLQAEPIWITAKKQGLRTAVLDWPLSHNQKGDITADFFNLRYESILTDEQRSFQALAKWEEDLATKKDPLNLMMMYIVGTDSAGHQHGPNSPEMIKVIEDVDTLLGKIKESFIQITKKYPSDYTFYFLITTDHGMEEVKYGVNLQFLAGLNENSKVTTITGGNVGHIFLDKITSKKERKAAIKEMRKQTKNYPFAKFYQRKDLPSKWKFDHKTRVGDVVVILDSGHIFTSRASKVIEDIKIIGGPLGMHGYDVRNNDQMKGFMALWRYPHALATKEIKEGVPAIEIHSMVAELLGIKPAKAAKKNQLSFLKL